MAEASSQSRNHSPGHTFIALLILPIPLPPPSSSLPLYFSAFVAHYILLRQPEQNVELSSVCSALKRPCTVKFTIMHYPLRICRIEAAGHKILHSLCRSCSDWLVEWLQSYSGRPVVRGCYCSPKLYPCFIHCLMHQIK